MLNVELNLGPYINITRFNSVEYSLSPNGLSGIYYEMELMVFIVANKIFS